MMKAILAILFTSVVFWVVVAGLGYVLFNALKRRGFFTRAAADAKQTLDQAAQDAVTKISDKISK